MQKQVVLDPSIPLIYKSASSRVHVFTVKTEYTRGHPLPV